MNCDHSKIKSRLMELKSIHCNSCGSSLVMKFLNFSQQIMACSNKNVS